MNQTVNTTETVLANLTGENMPNDIMINMDSTGNEKATSLEVIVEFSSKYQGESRTAQVADGFQLNYEYLNSGTLINNTEHK